MNNDYINKEYEVVSKESLVNYREQVTLLTELIDALQNIQNSVYWKVLEKHVFNPELAKSKRRLEVEKDTTEIFRLQGEVRLSRRYDLEQLILKSRDELSKYKVKSNE